MSILHNIDLGVDIGIHRRKWKSTIVWLVCVRGVFRAGALFYFIFTLLGFIFSCVRGTKTFFLSREKILECSPYRWHWQSLHQNADRSVPRTPLASC